MDIPKGDSYASIEPIRDALQRAGVIDDDVRITRSVGKSRYDKQRPRIEVRLRGKPEEEA